MNVEWTRRTAFFTFDQSSTKRAELCLFFFEKPQACANDITGRAVTALRHFFVNEGAEMIAEAEGGTFAHAKIIPKTGIFVKPP